jgi:hypothetical protein
MAGGGEDHVDSAQGHFACRALEGDDLHPVADLHLLRHLRE